MVASSFGFENPDGLEKSLDFRLTFAQISGGLYKLSSTALEFRILPQYEAGKETSKSDERDIEQPELILTDKSSEDEQPELVIKETNSHKENSREKESLKEKENDAEIENSKEQTKEQSKEIEKNEDTRKRDEKRMSESLLRQMVYYELPKSQRKRNLVSAVLQLTEGDANNIISAIQSQNMNWDPKNLSC